MQQAIKRAKTYFNALRDLIYPPSCPGCGSALLRGESAICITCQIDLPLNPYFSQQNNEVMQVFSGRLPLQTANALLYFNKSGIAQGLIHSLKYEDNEAIGEYLGNMLGRKLKDTLPLSVDIILPVPLHPTKQEARGYNQCHSIARGLQAQLGGDIDLNSVQRIKANPSQTRLNRAKRWDNVDGIFSLVDDGVFAGKHVLLVDDTLTTGATLESCGSTILKASNVTLSIATLAYAK
jgi:ComF family protein